jgi:hypothetical protein
MRHRSLLLIGAVALTARVVVVSLRPAHGTSSLHVKPAYSNFDSGSELSAKLNAAVAQELASFARDERAKKNRGEPYVDLGSRFEYLPAYGPEQKVAVSVLVGGPLIAVTPAEPSPTHGKSSHESRYLVFTYAHIGGRWVEISKPRWVTRGRGIRPSAASPFEAGNGLAAQPHSPGDPPSGKRNVNLD